MVRKKVTSLSVCVTSARLSATLRPPLLRRSAHFLQGGNEVEHAPFAGLACLSPVPPLPYGTRGRLLSDFAATEPPLMSSLTRIGGPCFSHHSLRDGSMCIYLLPPLFFSFSPLPLSTCVPFVTLIRVHTLIFSCGCSDRTLNPSAFPSPSPVFISFLALSACRPDKAGEKRAALATILCRSQ